MTYKDITNNKRVEVISVNRSGLGLCLLYKLDGVEYSVDGEFYIDRNSILHHTASDLQGEEIEILIEMDF